METMLIRETYKMIRTLDVRENYAFLECVNIRDREKRTCHLNLYEGDRLPGCLDDLERMENCPEFQEMFICDSTLVAVFDSVEGLDIDQVFYRGAAVSWQERLEMAELLLHRALTLSDLPPNVACTAMMSENLMVDLPGRQIRIRWHLPPIEGMNSRELVYLAIDQLRKILLERRESPQAELDFMDLLESGACRSVVQLYSLWREWKGTIEEAYQVRADKNIIRRWISDLWRFAKRKWKKRAKR